MSATIDDIRDYIVSTEKVAHVTFYLVKDKKWVEFYDHGILPEEEMRYFVYSESKKRGLEQLTNHSESYQNALVDLRDEIQHVENILEIKRKGIPTTKQVDFLFIHKIPIPLTLTWGEASDLIDEKLNQLEYEKQAYLQEKAEKFKGFAVGQRITCQFFYPTRLESGTIVKLTGNSRSARYMYVEYDNGTKTRWPLDRLPKIVKDGNEQEQTAIPVKVGKYHAGEQVSHAIFGMGEVLKSEMEEQTEFVEVQFEGKHGKKRLSMDFATIEKQETQPS